MCYCGFMPNLHKKSWTDLNVHLPFNDMTRKRSKIDQVIGQYINKTEGTSLCDHKFTTNQFMNSKTQQFLILATLNFIFLISSILSQKYILCTLELISSKFSHSVPQEIGCMDLAIKKTENYTRFLKIWLDSSGSLSILI